MSTAKIDDNWKKDFKDKLGDYEYPVRNGMWEDITDTLFQAKKHTKRILWTWISSAAMLTTLVVLAAPSVVNYISEAGLFDIKKETINNKTTKGKSGSGDWNVNDSILEEENEMLMNEADIVDDSINTETAVGVGNPEKTVKRKNTNPVSPEIRNNDENVDDEVENQYSIYILDIDSIDLREDMTKASITPVDTLSELTYLETDTIMSLHDEVKQPKERKDLSSWSFALSSKNMIYNGYRKGWQSKNMDDSESTVKTKKEFNHPINVSLTVRKQLNRRWAVESGLSYTYMRSKETTVNGSLPVQTNIKIHNLGVPVSVEYLLYSSHRINIYSKYGLMLEKTSESENRIKNWQVSTWLSAGISYRLAKNVGVFFEPGATYYFDNNTALPTLRNEVPLSFDVNVGLRFYPFSH